VIHTKKRIVGRRVIEKKKTHSGGALYPSGYAGSLFHA